MNKKKEGELSSDGDVNTAGLPMGVVDSIGGINLNPDLLDVQIKRDGAGVPLPVWDQLIDTMRIEGFVPIIIDVMPISLQAMWDF